MKRSHTFSVLNIFLEVELLVSICHLRHSLSVKFSNKPLPGPHCLKSLPLNATSCLFIQVSPTWLRTYESYCTLYFYITKTSMLIYTSRKPMNIFLNEQVNKQKSPLLLFWLWINVVFNRVAPAFFYVLASHRL